ncbi:hypothetical protein [Asaia spathodeae]|uniref:Uncharacterized protein n=1 Tax=Asaia spathodeae TaxID=657016 RepID=A0ABX2P434_9PROT|nr:hypothetical protein [Asaia spathodeae]GBR22589.1 hypothetical protein AA105894_3093 [Asaia spathodeae NBRC 105894]
MRKPFFFAAFSVALVLLAAIGADAWRLVRLDRQLATLPSQLDSRGWHLTWQEKRVFWRPWGSQIIFMRPILAGPQSRLWAGVQLSVATSPVHPLSLSFTAEGTQIVRLSETLSLTTGALHGRFIPSTRIATLASETVTVTGVPIEGIEALSLQTLTARLIPGTQNGPGSSAWAVDLRAQTVLPQFAPGVAAPGQTLPDHALPDAAVSASPGRLKALLALLPPPRDLHLIVTALNGDDRESGAQLAHYMGNGRYLIQAASFSLGPLTCIARGTLSHEGEGTLWAHLTGLQGFVRYGIAHAPESLRIDPEYARLFKALDEQTARIPDQLDLPFPVSRHDISLQNHIFAILTGHSR